MTLILFTAGCQVRISDQNGEPETASRTMDPGQRYMVPGQHISHPDVYSVQLHRSESENSAPVLRLHSNQQLTLRFDMIEAGSRQFRATITHHNPDWSRSPLSPENYMEGFAEAFFGGGNPSVDQRPAYRHYEYQFPNRQLSITESGNYLIHIEDLDSGVPIFVLPFFIHENKGEIVSSVETITIPRANLRTRHIPNSTYLFPDFINLPRFDLEYYFTQNQFWGLTRKADVYDTSAPDKIFYELSRDRAFTGDYELRSLEIPDIDRPGVNIREFRPDYVPPVIILSEDVQGLTQNLQTLTDSRFGRPESHIEGRYGNVHFRFQPRREIMEDQDIYLTGDFVNWMIRSNLSLKLNPETGFWETNTFIKEGSYTYKYVLMKENQIFDLDLDDTFRTLRQEYTTFVYYRDPARHYYRLLQINTFYSN